MPDVPQELVDALRQSRERFTTAFPERCRELAELVAASRPRADLQPIVHRLVGLAGTVGFPTVSQRATEFEHVLLGGTDVGAETLQAHIDGLKLAFDADASTTPDWLDAATPAPAVQTRGDRARVLYVEDDPDQRSLTALALENAGFEVQTLATAETLLEAAHAWKPRVIVLDVVLPGIDGLLACRLLKGDPQLAQVPVVFVSSRSALEERLSAIALGAADYLTKPYDVGELIFRLRRLAAPAPVESAPLPRPSEGETPYAEFVRQATAAIREGTVGLALIRVDPPARSRLVRALLQESRRRDIIGSFDRLHVVVLFPDLTPAVITGRLRPILDDLSRDDLDVRAGCASTHAAGMGSLDDLISQADRALAEARFQGLLVSHAGDPANAASATSTHARRILLADDDPDVIRIVDAQMKAQQFDTVLAFDGEAAMAALIAHPCDLAVVDLMLPKLTGFEVLQRMRDLTPRPKAVVLSARGREEDITRAFQLGADDYVTKPFRPQELAARVVRLLR